MLSYTSFSASLKRSTLYAALFFLLLTDVSVSSTDTVYQLAITGMPQTLDPAKTKDTDSSTVILQVFDTLFARDRDGRVSLALAEEYQVSEDRKTYSFSVRKDAVFHDGSSVESSDVVYSIHRKLKISGTEQSGLRLIKGVDPFLNGESERIQGVKVVDSHRFNIEFVKPFPGLPEVLSDLKFSIVPSEFETLLKDNVVIGSGPFILNQKTNDQLSLTRFAKYWGKKASLDRVIFRVLKNAEEAKEMLASGHLDNSHPFKLSAAPKGQFSPYHYLHSSVRFLGLNSNNTLLSDTNTRKALFSILPMSRYHKQLNPGSKVPISHFIPYGLPGYKAQLWESPMSKSDALKILKGLRGHKIELLTYLPDQELLKVTHDICRQWNLSGLNCNVVSLSLSELVQRMSNRSYQAFVGKLMPHVPDSRQLLAFFKKDGMFGLPRTNIDNLLDRAELVEALSVRSDIYTSINEEINLSFVAAPLMYMGEQKHYVRTGFILPYINVCGPYFMRLSDIAVRR